jgi:Arc/MetJ-type ribon-helix-helix transcriptional regulator
MHGDVIQAAFSTPLLSPGDKEPKGVIQYIPPGRHHITCKVNGETATREVVAKKGIEAVFQAGLEKLQASGVPPFFDYLHEGGRASGHPKRFFWDEERGLVCETEWTQAAKSIIQDRELQFFSPEFLLSSDGTPLGLHPSSKAIGGLVSDPAFETIESVAAQKAAKQQQPKTSNMDLTKFVELGVITAEQAKDPEKASGLIAEHITAANSKDKNAGLQADLIAAQKEKDDLSNKLKEMQEAQADAFIEEHVKAGRIKPKDESFKGSMRQQFLDNPETAKAIMDRIPASDLGTPVAKAAKAGAPIEDAGDRDLITQAKELIQAGKAKSVSEAIRSIGVNSYQDYHTSMGLGRDGAEQRAAATHAIMQAHRATLS